MLNPTSFKTFSKKMYVLMASVLMLIFLSSCMPSNTSPRVNKSGQNGTNNNSTLPTYQEPTFPFNSTFIQEGAFQSTSLLSVPVDFSDSFLLRGKDLSLYLRKLPNTTKFCLVGKYAYQSNIDKFLVLTAKPKSFTDLINKTTEYYLQVEPANDQANQIDCLSYNLTNTLYLNATAPTQSFSLQQLCTNCTTAVTSTPLKLYFVSGEEVSSLKLGNMILTVSGSAATANNSCSTSSACKARGYNCCLQAQCVNDGALRPGLDLLSSALKSAQEDVKLNPARFSVYPQYYFICESRPEGSAGSEAPTTNDPVYEANLRLMETKNLYDCLNKVDGEFSYCTVKFTDASERIPLTTFSASENSFYDDVNFTALNPNLTGEYSNNIVKIVYGGKTLYELNKTTLTGATLVNANDNLTLAQGALVTSSLPANALDDNLYLTYKVDGTCERVSSTMVKCSKTYVQGSTDLRATTYHNSTLTYFLPSYADLSTSSNVLIRVSGIVVPEDSTTWSKLQTPNRIVFNPAYPIYQNQSVEISYYVSTNTDALLKMKTAAQTQVNTICTCGVASKCNLKPLYDTNKTLINFECIHPVPTSTEPPINQTAFVSNKNVAHRYFDLNGVSYDESYATAPAQELTGFSYQNNNTLKPNNLTQYVGFNEIYGSFSQTNNLAARPAKMVKVKKDKTYDLIVNSGVFSSCLNCGSDYYSALQKIFPQNFQGQGGGYTPDYYESNRETNAGIYRGDDLLYGRACFVPATMIPWTHMTASNTRDQRQARLAAQHFLFANGYNRDWYGFDYGSLIGSFDGVTWFSIGNQRRIKAKTGKLFLAVNAYFGDQNVDSNFNVLVSETSAFSSDIPDHDTKTDGAECQRAHFCSSDNDCFRNFGYDYTCQNVVGAMTTWPQFDPNASEVVGSTTRNLVSILGGSNGQSKRCVYRGRGAPCLDNLAVNVDTSNYNGTALIGTLACSPNNSCLATSSNMFNNKIARFANSPLAQNVANAYLPYSDIVGLGARILGRPLNYYGSDQASTLANQALTQNNVNAICVPGKDVSGSTSTYQLHTGTPSTRTDSSDRILGVGATLSGVSPSSNYLMACPATHNTTGVSLHMREDLLAGNEELLTYTIQQNLSTNLLNLTPLVNQNIFSTTSGSQVTAVGYQRNACLRAPGAACFSNMECAPSEFIASKVRSVNLTGFMNEAEQKFWGEDLICGNPGFKYTSVGVKNLSFDIKKNKCCRDIGKMITTYTSTNTSTHQWCSGEYVSTAGNKTTAVADTGTAINSIARYSRVHTAYDKISCVSNPASRPAGKSFALSLSAVDSAARYLQILQQYKTLDTVNERTCCTGNWVRKFHSTNGGGNTFTKAKMQTIDKSMFKHISWTPQDNSILLVPNEDKPFQCDRDLFATPACEVVSLPPAEEQKFLNWAGTLELLGIPQVAVMTNDQVYKSVDDNQAAVAAQTPLDHSILDVNISGEDFLDVDNNKKYYSAASYSKFNTSKLKRVFSENEFNCCIPSSQEIPSTATSAQCCTGLAATIDNTKRCCLNDYTDVTVYLNRYVSSEGRGLPDSAYDEKTGYIKDPAQVALMAAQKNLCCSGEVMYGVAVNDLSKPIYDTTYLPKTPLTVSRRFVYQDNEVDNNAQTGNVGSFFDAGVRWNSHLYCVPKR